MFNFLLTKSCSVDYKEFPGALGEEVAKIRSHPIASYCFYCNHESLGSEQEYFAVNTM